MDSNNKYTCIFGGGAIRGVTYIGAMHALDELNISIKTIAGSSVGAIFAALISVGYSADEIEEMFLKVNFDLFRDIHFGFGKGFALSKGEVFLEWIREILAQKFYGENYVKNENPTIKFKDLDKNLVIITTDLTNFTCKEFSKTETPEFEVATAVRISSSMPGLMTTIKYENSELVDGDLQKSWPLWKLSKTLNESENRILEFRLEGDYDKNGKNAIDYFNTVFSCVTSVATKNVVETYGECDKYDYVTINTGDALIVDFNAPLEKRKDLIKLGYEQTMMYFKNTLKDKKHRLYKKYSLMLKDINEVIKQLHAKNVVQAKIALGEVYMDLCEVKPYIDETIYLNIQNAKFRIMNELKPSLLFRRYPAEKIKSINQDFLQIKNLISEKIDEINAYSKMVV